MVIGSHLTSYHLTNNTEDIKCVASELLPGDFDADGNVDLVDFTGLAACWLKSQTDVPVDFLVTDEEIMYFNNREGE